MNNTTPSLYDEIKAAGVPVGCHESDLYFPVTDATKAILARHPLEKRNATTFTNQAPPNVGELWYDVPFAYLPFWDRACYRISPAMKSKVIIEVKITVPTKREMVVREALAMLPEGNPDCIPGYVDMKRASERLCAAEQAKKDAEAAMSRASKQIREYVGKTWKPAEIPADVRDVLRVW